MYQTLPYYPSEAIMSESIPLRRIEKAGHGRWDNVGVNQNGNNSFWLILNKYFLCLHTHARTYIQTYIHTYTYVGVYMCA